MNNIYHTSFGQIELVVTPQQMYATADALDNRIKSARMSFEHMIRTVSETTSYWEGACAETERARLNGEQENFEKLFRNLRNYAEELKAITSLYVMNEKAAMNTANSLQAGILQ